MEFRERIEKELLPYVNKPLRYVGSEFNQIHKNPDNAQLLLALVYPDLYENALYAPLFEIYYHLLNRKPEVVVERIFVPDVDAETVMREKDIPLFSLENKIPVSRFQTLFFYIPSVLTYTNIFTILSLANIPFFHRERGNDHPLILGMGNVIHNPEPIADVFDGFLMLPPHQLLPEIVDMFLKQEGMETNRLHLLQKLRELSGMYIPSDWEATYNQFGEFENIRCTRSFSDPVYRESSEAEDNYSFQLLPLIPMVRIRQQPRMWDYHWGHHQTCSANFLKPPPDELLPVNFRKNLKSKLLKPLRQESILLLEDGFHLLGLWQFWKQEAFTSNKPLLLQIPGLKFLSPTLDLEKFVRYSQNLPFVILVEGISKRLRRMICKNVREEDIVSVFSTALQQGWRIIKLVFYLGLPTEKDTDVEEAIALIDRLLEIAKSFPNFKIIIECLQFIPEPQSPFQWEKQEDAAHFKSKLNKLIAAVSHPNVQWVYRSPFQNELEGILLRGNRRFAVVLKEAWQKGARLDNHPDLDNSEIWREAFAAHGIESSDQLKALSIMQPLPWDHLTFYRSKSELKKQKLAAIEGNLYFSDSRIVCLGYSLERDQFNELIQWMDTHKPGVTDGLSAPVKRLVVQPTESSSVQYGRRSRRRQTVQVPIKRRLRIRYAKLGTARFISHLDFIRIIDLVAARANIPLVYTQGKRPRPKMSFGPPLVTGVESIAEYMDMEVLLGREVDLQNQLNQFLPRGIQILQYKSIFSKVPSIASMVNRLDYEVRLGQTPIEEALLKEWLAKSEIFLEEAETPESSPINLRPFVSRLELFEGKLLISIRKIEDRFAKVTEVLESLFTPRGLDYRQFLVQRTGQFIEKDNQVLTPLDII